MKQSMYSILLLILLFFTSSVLLAASWHHDDKHVRFTPVSSQVQARSPEAHLKELEQAVLTSYNTYVAGAPEEDVSVLVKNL